MVCQWCCLCAGQQGGIGQGDYYPLPHAFGAGGALQDAVGVCAHELGDPQLALFLARLLEGEQGTLQQALLTKELLPGFVVDHLNPCASLAVNSYLHLQAHVARPRHLHAKGAHIMISSI